MMAYMKLFLVMCLATCLMAAESETKNKNDLEETDLQTDNSFGLGYYVSAPVSYYGRVGYYPRSYGGYYGGYGGYGYPSYGYGYRKYGYYGGYPYYSGYPYYGGYYR